MLSVQSEVCHPTKENTGVILSAELAVLDWRPVESARGQASDQARPPVPSEEPWPHLSAATAARPPRCPRRQIGRTRRAAAPTSGFPATPTSSFVAASARRRKSQPRGGVLTLHPAGNGLRSPSVLPAFGFRAADWLRSARWWSVPYRSALSWAGWAS